MPQHVKVNGHLLEFPDGMSDADMAKAIQANASQFATPPEQSTLGNLREGFGNAVYGLVKGAADPVYGLSQLALHGANALYQGVNGNTLSSTMTGKNSNAMQRLTDRYDNLIKDVEGQYQADTQGSIPAGVGRFVANVAPALATLGATAPATATTAAPAATSALARILADYPKAAAVLKGLVSGGATATTMPIDDVGNNDYWGKKALQTGSGAVIGGVVPMAANAVRSVYNSVLPAVNPRASVADNLARAVRGDANLESNAPPVVTPTDPVIGQMMNAGNVQSLNGARSANEVLARILQRKDYVPGSTPTTAQVVNTPQLSMAEKALMNNPAYLEAFSQRANENNAARLAQLGNLAQTPEALAAAVETRKAATQPLYQEAWAQTYPVNPELSVLLNRPSIQSAIARGQKLAAELPNSPTIGVQAPPVVPTTAPSNPFASLGVASAPAMAPEAGPSTVNGQTLQYLKMGLQDMQTEGRANGMGAHEKTALQNTLDSVHSWLIDNAPKYKAADAAYAQHSVPINDMRVGQAAQDALGLTTPAGELATTVDQLGARRALNSTGDTALTLNNYQAAVKKALSEEGAYGMSPEATKTTDAIAADLQRQSSGAAAVPKVGSDTAYNLQAPNWLSEKLFGSDLSGQNTALPAASAGIGGLLELLTGAGFGDAGAMAYALKRGAQNGASFVGNRVNQQYQKAMLDPDYYAQLLREGLARGLQQPGGVSVPAAGVAGSAAGSLFGN